MSTSVYAYNPQELAENTNIPRCYTCVKYYTTDSTLYKKYCNPLTNKTISTNSNPDKYILCDGYANPTAYTWILDKGNLHDHITALQNLVLGAYMLKDKAYFSSYKYNYTHYVNEAIRLIN
jgi:hypothetical protein